MKKQSIEGLEKNRLLTCAQCGKMDDNNKLCGKCKNVKYCNVECQNANWKDHKKLCVPGRLIETEKLLVLEAFGDFISLVCYHVQLKRNEVLYCFVSLEDQNRYSLCAGIQKKPNMSYHPTFHTSFVKLVNGTETEFEKRQMVKFNVNPENCKFIYNSIRKLLGFTRDMLRDGMFCANMDLTGKCLYDLEWKPSISS